MSVELQTAFQVTAPSGGLDGHMLLILAIMVVAGILGGAANYFLADRQGAPTRREWMKYPVLGVVAALTVPLFLNMISSTFLPDLCRCFPPPAGKCCAATERAV